MKKLFEKLLSVFISCIILCNIFTMSPALASERWFEEKEMLSGYSHSICVVGDTQIMSYRYPDDFSKIYDWILENKDEKKIEYVIGVGDISHTNTTEEWETAKEGITKLDGNIPYSLAKGSDNHDASAMFNRYFCNDTYMNGFGGFYEKGRVENAWRVFRAGNIDYLNVILDFGASDAVLEWAGEVIEAHPDHRVIINTHCYMYSDGELQNYTHEDSPHYNQVGTGSKNNGDEIWEKLASKYENVFLVLCGHYPSEQIVVNQRQGDNGNTVTEMLVNPQNVDRDEGATGLVATLYFSEDGKTMDVEYYSTVRNKYFLKSNQMTVAIPEYDGASVKSNWYGLDGDDRLMYNVDSNIGYSSLVLLPDSTGYSGEGFEYINNKIGGKADDDYYLSFDYDGSTPHHVSYYVDKDASELEEDYLIFKYNIFGDNGNLQLCAPVSETQSIALYQPDEKEQCLLKSDIWNSCLVVLDTKNQKCFGYINGIQTHIEEIGAKLLSVDSDYTSLINAGIYEFELNGYDIAGASDYLCIDDVTVVSSTYETLPENINMQSDSCVYGNYIVSSDGSVDEIESKGNVVIVCNSQANCLRNATTAVHGDKISVEYNDSLYGLMYGNYVVSKDIKNKFYDGSSSSPGSSKFAAANGVSVEKNSLGGKSSSDYYAAIGTASGEQCIYTNKKNTFDTRYCTMSFNVYGKGLKEVVARVRSDVKPRLLTEECSTYLADSKWNNIFMVYDSFTNVCKSYINGELAYVCNLFDETEANKYVTRDGDAFFYKETTDITSSVNISDTRICFANDTTVYFDDYATLYTDFEPIPIVEKTKFSAENATIKNKFIVIKQDKESANLVMPANVTPMVHNASGWSENSVVVPGDMVMLINDTPYGNIYDLETYTVHPSDYKLTVASIGDGMTFVQGGFPWIPDENGTVLNENGEKGINVNQTGTGSDILVLDAENIFGSKLNMKEVLVGYNSKSSKNSRFQADWSKAEMEQYCPYLVLEADIAFPKENHITGVEMQSKSGTAIGGGFEYSEELQNRVNHFVWVYDIENRYYEEFLNGEPIRVTPKKVTEKFATGEYTNVRIVFNGISKMTDSSIGTYEGGLKAYVQNLELYGCASPQIHKPLTLDTPVDGYYPVIAGSEGEVKIHKNNISGNGANVYIYNNDSFADEILDDDKLGAGNCIVVEEDGLYSYYDVCVKPDESVDYAVKSVNTTNSDFVLEIVDLGVPDTATFVMAEYDSDNNLNNITYLENVDTETADTVQLTLKNVQSNSYIMLYIWDDMTSIKPLCKEFCVK